MKKRNYIAVRQTSCRHCELDIEGFAPYRKGEWRDRGGNRSCNDGKHKHAPYIESHQFDNPQKTSYT